MAAYRDGLCPCGCGLPIKDAHHDGPFIVDTFTCYADRAIHKAKEKAKEAAKRNKQSEGWDVGVHYYVQPFEPEEG